MSSLDNKWILWLWLGQLWSDPPPPHVLPFRSFLVSSTLRSGIPPPTWRSGDHIITFIDVSSVSVWRTWSDLFDFGLNSFQTIETFLRLLLVFPSSSCIDDVIAWFCTVDMFQDADMFWDFISLRPETTHQVSFLFSDRGIPDGYTHMNGYGSHTFKLVNKNGKAVYCKFHYKVCKRSLNKWCQMFYASTHVQRYVHTYSFQIVCMLSMEKTTFFLITDWPRNQEHTRRQSCRFSRERSRLRHQEPVWNHCSKKLCELVARGEGGEWEKKLGEASFVLFLLFLPAILDFVHSSNELPSGGAVQMESVWPH